MRPRPMRPKHNQHNPASSPASQAEAPEADAPEAQPAQPSMPTSKPSRGARGRLTACAFTEVHDGALVPGHAPGAAAAFVAGPWRRRPLDCRQLAVSSSTGVFEEGLVRL